MENTTMKNCSSCGKPMEFNAVFCGSCGSRFVEKPTLQYCQSCGEVLEPNVAFCANCGKKVAEPQTPQSAFQQVANPSQQQVPPEKKKKKRGCFIAVGIVLLLFLLPIIAALFNGGEISVSSANIPEAYMASEINPETYEPVTKTDVFGKNSTKTVYATARVRNVPGNTKLSANWNHVSSGSNLKKDLIIEKDTWVSFSLDGIQSFPGPWTVEILINDKVARILNFKVE